MARVIHELAAGREARLAGRIGVHAQDPRRGEDRPRVVGSVRGHLADDRDAVGVGAPIGTRRPDHGQSECADGPGVGDRHQTTPDRKNRSVGPGRFGRHSLESKAVFARLEGITDGTPCDRVAATGGRPWDARPVQSDNESDAIDRRRLRQIDTERPVPLAARADPAVGVRPVDRVGCRKAWARTVVARLAAAQDIAGALDCLNVTEHGRPRVGPRHDEPQAARVGVHEPRSPRRQRWQHRDRRGALVRPGEAHPGVVARGIAIARLAARTGFEHLPLERRRNAARRRNPPEGPDDPQMGGPHERGVPCPRLRTGASGPCRVRASVDGEAGLVLRGIGRSHGEPVGGAQRIEHRGPFVRRDESHGVRSRLGGLDGPAERDGQDRREQHERRSRHRRLGRGPHRFAPKSRFPRG